MQPSAGRHPEGFITVSLGFGVFFLCVEVFFLQQENGLQKLDQCFLSGKLSPFPFSIPSSDFVSLPLSIASDTCLLFSFSASSTYFCSLFLIHEKNVDNSSHFPQCLYFLFRVSQPLPEPGFFFTGENKRSRFLSLSLS